MNFKQFLLEAAVKEKPKYFNVDVEEAIALLNTYCKNALWMLAENAPIYRGDYNANFPKSGFMVVDTTATERRSQNTSNFYTVILDNHPNRKDFPKRSRSFIASTQKNYAWGYGNLYVIVPADDAKIGFVNREDMWDTRIRLFGINGLIEDFNEYFKEAFRLGRAPVIKDFYEFDKLLKKSDPTALRRFRDAFNLSDKSVKQFKDHFLDNIWEAYSAGPTGHTAHTTATMPHKSSSEVWVGGKAVLIEYAVWEKMQGAYLAQRRK